jgi:hypothetical protein
VLAVGVTSVVYAAGGPLGLVAAALAGAFLMTVGPGASLVSLLVVWTGYSVTSCPYCPEFGFRRVGVQHATCAVCDTEEYQIGTTMNGWTHHMSEDEWTCSLDCASEYNEEVRDA